MLLIIYEYEKKQWPQDRNKIIGFLRRNLPIKNTEAKTLAYKSMVRSNLEYCANIWSPHTEKLKSKLEQVQRRAARYVQYSRFDLTMDLYAKVLASVFLIGRFRLKKPMILFAFEVMLLI
jgi:hypothetical protein